jgi:retinol dehydrogenase-12
MPGDLSGRAFLVTGGNTGIGLATATGLAARGGRVCITSRSAAKAQAAVAAITACTGNAGITWLQLNLADLASVRRSAQEFLARGEPLHVLISNAGLAGQRGRTADGFELAFGVNHLGTFAFTTALLDRLAASSPARVVTVSSAAHYAAKGIDFTAVRRRTRSVTGLPEYQVSKLGNVLFSQELARRLAGTGITSYALHPGLVASDIWRRVPWPARSLLTRRMLSIEDGALTSLYCATSPDVASDSGLFYDKCQPRPASSRATPELGHALWEQSEAWTGA